MPKALQPICCSAVEIEGKLFESTPREWTI